ncbi:UDP-N-acetylmuramate--L-alanine ligase [Agreia bicolorata]|uniref:UDP-N-acetylmuramate--L-alanine ligase n=1 Tax=Agreia bicolorata TaxID=110935 RepID=A0A1T4YCZ0_9MICO|nr:UDP-N-acetylmuramate--L-alanine ligase [Agreia bicolorata]KJC63192.1 UDP-N-acetylmuramate--alanine ligase [Agreia bicolorata]SKA99171.1 UDP-N-acetylmuramate--L-alanine ligase [Agreia bicolorata]
MIKPDLSQQIPAELGAVHFVGIGGSGMSGIARLMIDAGIPVSGSDAKESKGTKALRERGARISIGHAAENLGDADTLVVTSALWPDNPEYLLAKERGIPILHRSQALAWVAGRHRLVAVAGAHGKTTSTGMIVTGLIELGQKPGFVNGGVISALGTSSASGEGEIFVLEADESDGSFLLYDKAVALITNVDPDHLDHYGSVKAVEDAFVTFADEASELVVISADDAGAIRVSERLGADRVLTFGENENADVRLHSVETGDNVTFQVRYLGNDYAGSLLVPGRHNALNAAGAFAVLVGMGFAPAETLDAIARFGGTGRRFELHDTVRGVSVYDDYAHHPTEVAAALTAARTVVGEGRIIAVHQPHLYSRTQLMAGEFAETLERTADFTIVLDVCGAREDPVPGVTGALVSEKFANAEAVRYIDDWQKAADFMASIARPGDFVVTLGCGDVNLIVPQLLDALARETQAPPAA